MSLSWVKQWLRKPVPVGGRKIHRIVLPRRRDVRLAIETLEDRCLLDAGLGNLGAGLRNAALVYDINAQIQALNNPNVLHQQPLGYLYGDLGSLIGNVVSSIPGADTKTIGQAFTTAGDLARLGFFIKTNGLKDMNTQSGQAVQDFLLARQDLVQAGVAYSQGSLTQRNNWVTKANDLDTDGASKINEWPSPAEEPVTQALNDMYLLNNDAAYLPDPRAGANGINATNPRFQKDEGTVVSSLPWSATGIIEGLSDLLAVAGDVSSLAGGPVGAIVGDALETAHDALAVGGDLAENKDPTSDLLSLGADGLSLINDSIPAPNPNSQPLAVSANLSANGSNPLHSGSNFSGSVATFSDPNVSAHQSAPPAGAYTAYISWGDGSSSFGQIAVGNGGNAHYTVSGTHLYTTPGDYSVNVVIAGNGAQGQGAENATVSVNSGGKPPPVQGITVAGQNLTTQGSLTIGGSLATVYAPPGGTYTATIDWGDGTTSTGQIISTSNSVFAVTGAHTYSQSGGYLTNVLVNDSNGHAASAFGSVNLEAPSAPPPPSGNNPPSGSAPIASPPTASPPPFSMAPNNPSSPGTSSIDQIFAEVEQIVAEVEAEIQQLLNAEMAILSNLLHSSPNVRMY